MYFLVVRIWYAQAGELRTNFGVVPMIKPRKETEKIAMINKKFYAWLQGCTIFQALHTLIFG